MPLLWWAGKGEGEAATSSSASGLASCQHPAGSWHLPELLCAGASSTTDSSEAKRKDGSNVSKHPLNLLSVFGTERLQPSALLHCIGELDTVCSESWRLVSKASDWAEASCVIWLMALRTGVSAS